MTERQMMLKMPPRCETWINQRQWHAMLNESHVLMDRAARLKRAGMPTTHVWQEIAPINKTIRSKLLKVRGIDDRGADSGARREDDQGCAGGEAGWRVMT